MNTRKLQFYSAGKRLEGTFVAPSGDIKGALLRISGGANIGHSPNEWQEILAKSGIASFAFDFRGVDKSEGELHDTNLNTRLADSKKAYSEFVKLLGHDVDISILGVSMGAPIAIWLAHEVQITHLLLAVAAAYPADSHNKNFGKAFSQSIRREGAWRTSVEFSKLQELKLPVLFASALKDDIIPRDITAQYRDVIRDIGGVSIDFDVPHAFLRSSSDYPKERHAFWAAVCNFITSTAT